MGGGQRGGHCLSFDGYFISLWGQGRQHACNAYGGTLMRPGGIIYFFGEFYPGQLPYRLLFFHMHFSRLQIVTIHLSFNIITQANTALTCFSLDTTCSFVWVSEIPLKSLCS